MDEVDEVDLVDEVDGLMVDSNKYEQQRRDLSTSSIVHSPEASQAHSTSSTKPRLSRLSQIGAMLWGLFIVIKHAFRKPVTVRYPEEKKKLPLRSRGRHYLTKWNDGKERCVGCELCAIVCPSQAIYVKPAENEPGEEHSHGERYASDFQINMLRCIFCGMCEEACPTGAIILGNEYELAAFDRESLIYTKEMLTEKHPGDSGRDPNREI